MERVNLLDFNRQGLQQFVTKMGEKPFRALQIMRWVYHRGCDSFYHMSDLNEALRARLAGAAMIQAPEIALEQVASDGTIKWALAVGAQQIETVYIPESERGTLCISSQVGCALNCSFCSTAQQGFNRNLGVSEIIGQIWRANRRLKEIYPRELRPITNVVMMGMGEPLLNLTNIVPAMEIMLDDLGFGLSKRRLTLSTSGVVPALDKLGEQIDVSLAVSLHAPNDPLRDQLVPINRKYNIAALLAAVRRYLSISKANRGRVTIEYVMLHQINDTMEHAHQLAGCLKNTPSKINLIPWNPFPGSSYRTSPTAQIERFAEKLSDYGFTVTVRKTRGGDIDAACGQLAGEVVDRTQRKIKIGELIAVRQAGG